MKIRWHLVLLVCAALLPVLIFVSVLTGLFWSQQRATLDQGYLEGVRGLTLALEAEISASVHTLQALALSPELDTQSPSRFSNTLSRVLSEQKRWSTIALVDSFGKRLFTVGKQPAKLIGWTGKHCTVFLRKASLSSLVWYLLQKVRDTSQKSLYPWYATAS